MYKGMAVFRLSYCIEMHAAEHLAVASPAWERVLISSLALHSQLKQIVMLKFDSTCVLGLLISALTLPSLRQIVILNEFDSTSVHGMLISALTLHSLR